MGFFGGGITVPTLCPWHTPYFFIYWLDLPWYFCKEPLHTYTSVMLVYSFFFSLLHFYMMVIYVGLQLLNY